MTSQISEPSENQQHKFCRDCKHLIGKRMFPDEWEKWECGHVNNQEGHHSVSGMKSYRNSILVTRNEYCSGHWWEEYIYYQQEQVPTFDQGSLADLRKLAQEKLASRAKKISSADLENL